MPHNSAELSGQVFDRLTVISFVGIEDQQRMWLCLCRCGATTIISTRKLRAGRKRSCGCIRKEQLVARNSSHGATGTSEHTIWLLMRNRCSNPKNKRWARYGGRGIKVCPEWQDDFSRFLADVGSRPSPLHSIDRINNDGNYEPGNVRWATKREQVRNSTATLWVNLNGARMTLTECAGALALPTGTLSRYLRRGMTMDAVVAEAARRAAGGKRSKVKFAK